MTLIRSFRERSFKFIIYKALINIVHRSLMPVFKLQDLKKNFFLSPKVQKFFFTCLHDSYCSEKPNIL